MKVRAAILKIDEVDQKMFISSLCRILGGSRRRQDGRQEGQSEKLKAGRGRERGGSGGEERRRARGEQVREGGQREGEKVRRVN